MLASLDVRASKWADSSYTYSTKIDKTINAYEESRKEERSLFPARKT